MTNEITIALPSRIDAKCAAGSAPQFSRIDDMWVIHPADYDPDEIAEADLVHDEALRALTVEEVEALYAYGTLHDYQTGEAVRPATAEELIQSLGAGETGAFDLDGRAVYLGRDTEYSTVAEVVAEFAGGDGLVWPDDAETLADGYGKRIPLDDGDEKLRFRDDSTIVFCVSAWDIGFSGDLDDCRCWPAACNGSHADDCPHAEVA